MKTGIMLNYGALAELGAFFWGSGRYVIHGGLREDIGYAYT